MRTDQPGELEDMLAGQLILAPLTRGGNVPFRRLCSDFGANVTMSEMAYARNLFKGWGAARKREIALCKQSPLDSSKFGFQVATKSSDELIRASQLALENGAAFIDLNCGCPIHEASRRGLGASMLKKPEALLKMVRIASQSCAGKSNFKFL